MARYPGRVLIFDTTMRDGEQSPGASFILEEKLAIAQKLVRLSVESHHVDQQSSSQRRC
ncbi:MAG: hypothetical protein RLZZ206_2182 [Cyanobacteriota bacterium]|jgi:2-isopropylmalate synthase